MKIVVLFGSPRKDGNTRQLADAFIDGARKDRNEVRVLYLNDMNIRPCQGCLSCAERGVCRINDDMRDICKYIMESDVVAYATPLYWSGPSAQLKLVIDRSIAFLDEALNSRVKGKRAVSLISCADDDVDACAPAREVFKRIFEGLGMEYAGSIEATGCEEKGSVPKEILNGARNMARSLSSKRGAQRARTP